MNLMNRKKEMAVLVIASIILYLSANLFFGTTLGSAKLDFTEEKLYTLSEGSKEVLSKIEEPIEMKLYFSEILGDASPTYQNYFARVRSLLAQYSEVANGKLQVKVLNPEPYSELEDDAMASGLEGIPVNQAGDMGYFGLVGTNMIDNREVIGFMSMERERFLEYDLTKLIYSLANYQKRIVGVINPLQQPVMNPMSPPPSWMIFQQMEEFFDVRQLGANPEKIPEEITTLVVLKPSRLEKPLLQQIEQYVLKGGNLMMFVDPIAESGGRQPESSTAEVEKLLAGWGVKYHADKVSADYQNALSVRINDGGRAVVDKYIVWLGLNKTHLNDRSAITSELEQINIATAGFLMKDANSTLSMEPLMTLGEESMAVDAMKLQFNPDIASLTRNYQPEGVKRILSARVNGTAKAVLADQNQTDVLWESKKSINVLLVADTDILRDDLWLNRTNFLGQDLVVPTADNGSFMINALDDLSGDTALVGLRGRGQTKRTFELLEQVKAEAEQKYRLTERSLIAKLKELEEKIKVAAPEGEAGKEQTILTKEQEEMIDQSKTELLQVRKELRDVRHALRQDMEQVESVTRFVNIFFMPVLLVIVAVLVGIYRHRARNRAFKKELA